jgi:hypothetical protein
MTDPESPEQRIFRERLVNLAALELQLDAWRHCALPTSVLGQVAVLSKLVRLERHFALRRVRSADDFL